MIKIYITVLAIFLSFSLQASIKPEVRLNVPLVKQGKMLCGPATVEMLFKYWGVNKYDQYDIAASMLDQFPKSKRYLNSGILDTNPYDFSKYPGTGTINLREFLKRFGSTRNFMLESEPKSEALRIENRDRLFSRLKSYISNGVPVIVHQYWALPKSRGHYRIVTGYNENRQVVYLNDANGGKRISQTYDEFLSLWNVDQRWLHYNAIAFNVLKNPVIVNL